MHTFKESKIRSILTIEGTQQYKLAGLNGSKLQPDPSKVIHNISSYQLSNVKQPLLCKGLNFALRPLKLKFENHGLPFKLLVRDIFDKNGRNESLLHIQSKIKDIILSSFRLCNKKDDLSENLSEEEYGAFIQLSSNKNIIIQKADRGNTVVILD